MKVQIGTNLRSIASFEKVLRLKRFEAGEKSRKVAEVEQLIRELERMATDLDLQVMAEEERTRINDPANCAYSTLAQSARRRRDNLRGSAVALLPKLEAARRERDEALEQLEQLAAPTLRKRLEKTVRVGWRKHAKSSV